MALRLGVVSQKGGVGKSTIVRLIASEYAKNDWRVKIADMDLSQGTSTRWNERRLRNAIDPEVSVEQFSRVTQATRTAKNYDLLIFDGAPHSNAQTLEVAKVSNLVILPTGTALDDLEPTVQLANELSKKKIPKERIAVTFCRVGNSEVELAEAQAYVNSSEYFLLKGEMPERTGYRRASDAGRAATETAFQTLNQRADEIVQAIVDRIGEIS